MKKILVLLAVLAFAVPVFSGPTIGFRTWPGTTVIPEIGVQYAGQFPVHVSIDFWKANIWEFEWAGDYWFNPVVSAPLTSDGVARICLGMAIPMVIDTEPLTLAFPTVYGNVGLSVDAGRGSGIYADAFFNGDDLWYSVSVKADLLGIIATFQNWLAPKAE